MCLNLCTLKQNQRQKVASVLTFSEALGLKPNQIELQHTALNMHLLCHGYFDTHLSFRTHRKNSPIKIFSAASGRK